MAALVMENLVIITTTLLGNLELLPIKMMATMWTEGALLDMAAHDQARRR